MAVLREFGMHSSKDYVHRFWSHFRVLLTEKEHKNDSYQPKYFMLVCASLMKKFFQQNVAKYLHRGVESTIFQSSKIYKHFLTQFGHDLYEN